MSLARASTAAGALLLFAAAQAADVPVPALTARVTDQASLLSPDQRAALESKLADYEAKKGSQIAVLTVASTEPEAIEDYGIRVAEVWRIGRKGTADGVILIVAKDNPPALRRLRIEVGRGLEGAIPDAYAKRVLDEDVAPRFRQGDFYGGLVAGVDRIESLLQGEALPPPPDAPAPSRDSGDSDSGGMGLIFLFLFIVLPIVLRMLRSRSVGYAAGSRALNGSLGSFVTGAVLGSLTSGRGGGFGGGGFGGGGGGGGFSGGGGDFGGGGASGNW